MSYEDKYPFTKIVVKEIEETMVDQDVKGMEKYGKALDPLDENYDWLKMAEEELADMIKYLKAEQHKRDYLLSVVLTQLDSAQRHAESIGDEYISNTVLNAKRILGLLDPS